MHETVTAQTNREGGLRAGTWVFRLLGLGLLAVLLVRADLGQLSTTLQGANPLLVLAAVGLIPPLIFVKTVRWQGILRSQSVQFRIWPAYMAYFGSLFVGFLTPGRLGEFVKALHVSEACGVSAARAFASVLADRLFDLYLLLIVGGVALLALTSGAGALATVALIVAPMVILPAVIMVDERAFAWVKKMRAPKVGRIRAPLTALIGWAVEVRGELQRLDRRRLFTAGSLTVLAYLVFFGQCYLLALALDLGIGFIQVSYVIALGSLVTLLPVSISGLGTREAVSIAYLGTLGVSTEAALGFSLLVFLTFYVGGGLMGALAWWAKPVPAALPWLRAKPSVPGA